MISKLYNLHTYFLIKSVTLRPYKYKHLNSKLMIIQRICLFFSLPPAACVLPLPGVLHWAHSVQHHGQPGHPESV